MTTQKYIILLAAAAVLLLATACERDTSGLAPAPFDTNPVVFHDQFDGIDYQAFLGSKLDALDVVTDEFYGGEASIEITVPNTGYAGGAITANMPRDLSQYNAVAFWAKASIDASLNEVGYGNDNSGTSKYTATVKGLALTTTWQRFILPIPATGKLVPERGLFYFSEGPENGAGYTIWFDEIEYVNVDAISNPRPVMDQDDVSAIAGVTVDVQGCWTAFDVTVPDPRTLTVYHSASYFTFASSDEDVAVPGEGVIRVVGGGSADITATLEGVNVAGRFTIDALAPPTDHAPTPTRPAADVISVFSNAYPNHPVDTFSPEWEDATVSNLRIAGDDVKVYNIPTALDVAVIEFATQTIDASSMTHIHIDIWQPRGTFFGMHLFSFGPDGVFSGEPAPSGDDSQGIVAVQPPTLKFNQWVGIDIPLSDFTAAGLEETAHLAQVVLRSDSIQLIVDNIYFYKDTSQVTQ